MRHNDINGRIGNDADHRQREVHFFLLRSFQGAWMKKLYPMLALLSIFCFDMFLGLILYNRDYLLWTSINYEDSTRRIRRRRAARAKTKALEHRPFSRTCSPFYWCSLFWYPRIHFLPDERKSRTSSRFPNSRLTS